MAKFRKGDVFRNTSFELFELRPPVEDAGRPISGLGIKRPEIGEPSLQFTTPKFVGEGIALPEYDGNESSDLKVYKRERERNWLNGSEKIQTISVACL